MPLEGLRAWIGEVERKLGMRTRVFLVLTAIAIGGAGAAIYLALDTRDNAVSEKDVRALQEDLEARIATGGAGGGADLTELEADLRALEAEVAQLRRRGGGEPGGAGGKEESGRAPDTGSSDGASGGASSEGASSNGAEGDASSKARLRELLEDAKRQDGAAEAQGEQADGDR